MSWPKNQPSFFPIIKKPIIKSMKICVNACLKKNHNLCKYMVGQYILETCEKMHYWFLCQKKTKKGKHIHIFMIFCIMGSTCLQLILQCTYNSVSIASNASPASLSAVSLSSFAQLLTWKHTNDEDDENDVRA